MPALLALFLVSHALANVHLDYKTELVAQGRGGINHEPGLPPIGDTYLADLILIPGVEGALRTNRTKFLLRYSPELIFSLVTPAGLQTLHRANAEFDVGKVGAVLATAGVSFIDGALDLSSASGLISGFNGTLGPSTTNSYTAYFSIGLSLKFEANFKRAFKFISTNTAGIINTSPITPLGYITNPGLAYSDSGALESQHYGRTVNQLTYLINTHHSVNVTLEGQYVSFPGTATYVGYLPQAGWEATYSKFNRLSLRLGLMKYWVNPYPGIYLAGRYLMVGNLTYEHAFHELGLPRLKLQLMAGITPYNDLIVQALEPRGNVSAALAYLVNRQITLSVSGRWYTADYYDGTRFIPVAPGRIRNIYMADARLRYTQSKYLAVEASVVGSYRQIVPSRSSTYTTLDEIYFLLGATGTWQGTQ